MSNVVNVDKSHRKVIATPLVQGLMDRAGISAKSEKQTWEDVDSIYESIAEGIYTNMVNVRDSVQVIQAANTANDNKELLLTVKSVTHDLTTLSNELVQIKSRHEGKVGVIESDEDNSICLSVFSDYATLNDRMRAVIFPALLTLTEFTAEAAEAYRKLETPVTIDQEAQHD
jgi:hypothetical protein